MNLDDTRHLFILERRELLESMEMVPNIRRTSDLMQEITAATREKNPAVINPINVDVVNDGLDIAGNDIESSPAYGVRIPRSFIHGTGKVAGRFDILLDVDQVLSLDERDLIAAHTADADALMAGEPA